MPRFTYRAKRGPSEIVEGKIEADNKRQAAVKLSGMGLFPLLVEEETAAYLAKSSTKLIFARGVPLRDLSNFTRQLSNLLDSGLTMLNALGILIEQAENPHLKNAINLVRDDIRDGVALSVALGKHPKVFSRLYVNMVSSGEVGGNIEEVLKRLGDFLERDEETVSKIRASLVYPALMAIVGTITIFVLLTFVAPRLISVFVDIGQELPLPTKLLIAISTFLSRFWIFIIIAAVVSIFAFARWAKTAEGKGRLDRARLKLPLIGQFIQKAEIARFGRTLGTLIENGVPIINALAVAATTIDNGELRAEVEKARKDVIEGAPLSAGIKSGKYFPPMVISMLAVGEESGALERSLYKIADTYDIEIDRTIKTITSMLEPSLVLFMGLVVGFIVIAMLLPIFQINMMAR